MNASSIVSSIVLESIVLDPYVWTVLEIENCRLVIRCNAAISYIVIKMVIINIDISLNVVITEYNSILNYIITKIVVL